MRAEWQVSVSSLRTGTRRESHKEGPTHATERNTKSGTIHFQLRLTNSPIPNPTLDPISLAPLFLGVVVVFVLDGFATFPVRLGEDRGIDKVFADGEFRGRRRSSGGTGAGSGRVRQGKVERRFRRHAGWVTANEE
jgi:hypothetical protein